MNGGDLPPLIYQKRHVIGRSVIRLSRRKVEAAHVGSVPQCVSGDFHAAELLTALEHIQRTRTIRRRSTGISVLFRVAEVGA
jgi:hypothetical protein